MNNTTQKNEQQELAPCPFCGGEAVLHHIEPHTHHLKLEGLPIMPDHSGCWTIECCDVGMIKDSREEVVSAWNRRTTLSRPSAIRAQAVEEAVRIAENTIVASYEGVDEYGDAVASAIRSLASQPVQDGWVLVPVEPTQGMIAAFQNAPRGGGIPAAYRDMIKAAPTAAQRKGEEAL